MRAMEYLQLDPLHILARSQDIALHSRVLDYTPELWEAVTYQRRQFFDWGSWLAVRPMDELPYWRVVMRRERDSDYGDPRLRRLAHDHAEAIVEMRAVLRERGVVSNRDFAMAHRTRTSSYRGRKDSALALYYLWYTGEVMTHHRDRFERVYALTEQVAPAHLRRESDEAETDRFLVKKEIGFNGLARLSRTSDSFRRGEPDRAAKKVLGALLADGDLIEVQVEGWKAMHYALGGDAPTLRALSAGRLPKAWTPLETNTTEEAVFLAPLDHVSARGRAKSLFGFDYVWEVYTPLAKRKHGYYVLPILFGDRLVGRVEPRFDRKETTLHVRAVWLERGFALETPGFEAAFHDALSAYARFVGATRTTFGRGKLAAALGGKGSA